MMAPQTSPQPTIVLLTGMPASGKSTIAIQLAARLGFIVAIGTDEIREVMRLYDQSPSLAGQSHDRWQLFGELTDQTYTQGYVAHAKVLRLGVMAVIEKNVDMGESLVVEGVHLLPSLYREFPGATLWHFVLRVNGPDQHWVHINRRLSRRQGLGPGWTDEKVEHVSRTQDYLLVEAENYGVPVITADNPEEALEQIMTHISASA